MTIGIAYHVMLSHHLSELFSIKIHPDAAFSRFYVGPRGLDDERCNHSLRRCSVGPTSRRKRFTIIVDQCRKCGRIVRTVGKDLTWPEYIWLRRINKRSLNTV